jgi:hypothetical protein
MSQEPFGCVRRLVANFMSCKQQELATWSLARTICMGAHRSLAKLISYLVVYLLVLLEHCVACLVCVVMHACTLQMGRG